MRTHQGRVGGLWGSGLGGKFVIHVLEDSTGDTEILSVSVPLHRNPSEAEFKAHTQTFAARRIARHGDRDEQRCTCLRACGIKRTASYVRKDSAPAAIRTHRFVGGHPTSAWPAGKFVGELPSYRKLRTIDLLAYGEPHTIFGPDVCLIALGDSAYRYLY